MITHKEVRNIILGDNKDNQTTITLDILLSKLAKYQGGKMLLMSLEEYTEVLKYITQQEKKDMLLELYRDFHYGNHDAETDLDILRQIKALEEQLK
jgi:hypothetical protein